MANITLEAVEAVMEQANAEFPAAKQARRRQKKQSTAALRRSPAVKQQLPERKLHAETELLKQKQKTADAAKKIPIMLKA